jgi:hypothetical protein
MENIYTLLIGFMIFLVYQKSFALFMEYKFPTYQDVQNSSPYWQNMYKLRVFNALISFVFTMYILLNYKVNQYIFVIFSLLLISNINFFLFNNQLIYYVVPKNNDNNTFVHFMATKTNIYLNYITAFYVFYALAKIFVFN